MTSYQKIEGKEKTHSKIKVWYSKGGMNYFNSQVERRGIYVTLTFVELSKAEGYTTETTAIFGQGNFKVLYLQTKKANAKELAEAENYIKSIAEKLHAAHIAGNEQLVFDLVKNGQPV